MSKTARDEDDAALVRAQHEERLLVEVTVEAVEEIAKQVARKLADKLGGDVEVTIRIRER